MLSKSFRGILSIFFAFMLLFLGACTAGYPAKSLTTDKNAEINNLTFSTGILYEQPVDPNGKLLLSAWLDPDGSDFDEYVWDNFMLQSDETITEVDWYGVYDPLKFGKGGPVLDFHVSIYPSIPSGTEPDVAVLPLVEYRTGGNAGETVFGTISGAALYAYAFRLPTPFAASAGVKYWVQIEAFQQGTVPDWCFAAGTGGDGTHYWRGRGAGGDVMYRSLPGDAAFRLLGSVTDTATPTDTHTEPPTQIPTETPTGTPSDTPTVTPTDTLTSTPTNTPAPMDTATGTPTTTPTATNTATGTSTINPEVTPTDTSTGAPTVTPTDTPTSTPIPLANVHGRVTGGGNMDTGAHKSTFGFVVRYQDGDDSPSGNLTFQDHVNGLTLQATSFTLLYIDQNHAQINGYGAVNGDSSMFFTLDVYDHGEPGDADVFSIQIPGLDGYSAGGVITGGNIQISAR